MNISTLFNFEALINEEVQVGNAAFAAYVILAVVFFEIGLFAFGGGTAMLPLIYQNISRFGVMDAADFSDMVALSQITPGPVAVNAATYVGMQFGGVIGAVVATFAVCLPCFIVMLVVIKLLDRYKDNKYVEGAFVGIRPVTVGLILAASIFIAQGVLVKGSLISSQMMELEYYNILPIGIFALSIVSMSAFKFKPIYVMLAMAVAGGLIYGYVL